MWIRTLQLRLLILALATSAPAASQMMIRKTAGPASGGVFLHELGVVAAPERDHPTKLTLIAVFPGVKREIPLQEGDQVLMIDGARVRGVDDLKTSYDAAAIGSTVKLAIRRGDERFLTSFERAEKKAGHDGPRVMIVGGPGAEHDDIEMLHEFHAVIAAKDGELRVVMLPMDTGTLKQQDKVLSFNGLDVSTLDAFRDAYQALKIGEGISIRVSRGSEELSFSRAKSEAPAGMIRKIEKTEP